MSGCCLLRIVDQYRDFSFILFYLVTIHRNDSWRVNNARGTCGAVLPDVTVDEPVSLRYINLRLTLTLTC